MINFMMLLLIIQFRTSIGFKMFNQNSNYVGDLFSLTIENYKFYKFTRTIIIN